MSLAGAAAKLLAGCMLLHAVRHGREGACPAAPCVREATVALTSRVTTLDPAFLVLSEPRALWMRIVVPLIRPDRAMQGISRVKQVAVVVLKAIVLAPLCQFLWFLDDVLYPAHRDVALQAPVFILAPPRTGSTSLHRALVSDADRFFAPLTLELFFPFITVQKALHYLHDRPALRRPVDAFIAAFVAALRITPGEVAQRHPMGLFKEDEDDIGLTVHHQTSEICWCAVSHIESFLWGAHAHRLPVATQRRSALFLTRVYQKIAFVRGRGRTLCTKSHLIGLLPALQALHPTARFVTIVRPIEGVFPSFWSLQCAISRDFGRIDSSGPEYRDMRVVFLKEMHAELRRRFGDGGDANRRVLTFANFVADAAAEVAELYDGWALSYDIAALRDRVGRYLAAEEHSHSFGNASWEDIGLRREDIAQLVQCPMLTYGRLNKRPRDAAPAAA